MMTLNFQDIDLDDRDQLAEIFANLHVAGIKKVQLQIKSDQEQTQQFIGNLTTSSEMLKRNRNSLLFVYPLAAVSGLSAIYLGLWLWV